MISKSLSLILGLSTVATSHFVLQVPLSLGFDDVKETTAPCNGFDATDRSGGVTDWPVAGSSVVVLSTHQNVTWEFNAALLSGIKDGTPTWRAITLQLAQQGVGTFCEPQIPGPPEWTGLDAVLQIIQHAPDGALYQCAAIRFQDLPFAGPDPACTNDTGIAAQWLGGDTTTSSSSIIISSTTSSSSVSTSSSSSTTDSTTSLSSTSTESTTSLSSTSTESTTSSSSVAASSSVGPTSSTTVPSSSSPLSSKTSTTTPNSSTISQSSGPILSPTTTPSTTHTTTPVSNTSSAPTTSATGAGSGGKGSYSTPGLTTPTSSSNSISTKAGETTTTSGSATQTPLQVTSASNNLFAHVHEITLGCSLAIVVALFM